MAAASGGRRCRRSRDRASRHWSMVDAESWVSATAAASPMSTAMRADADHVRAVQRVDPVEMAQPLGPSAGPQRPERPAVGGAVGATFGGRSGHRRRTLPSPGRRDPARPARPAARPRPDRSRDREWPWAVPTPRACVPRPSPRPPSRRCRRATTSRSPGGGSTSRVEQPRDGLAGPAVVDFGGTVPPARTRNAPAGYTSRGSGPVRAARGPGGEADLHPRRPRPPRASASATAPRCRRSARARSRRSVRCGTSARACRRPRGIPRLGRGGRVDRDGRRRAGDAARGRRVRRA